MERQAAGNQRIFRFKFRQLPQFILDDAIGNKLGGACRIICTQPRRIAATGLAARVASERCEKVTFSNYVF